MSQASDGNQVAARSDEAVPQPGPQDPSFFRQEEDRRFDAGFQAPGLALEPTTGRPVENQFGVAEVNGRARQDSAGSQDFELQLLVLQHLEGVEIHLAVPADSAVEIGRQLQQLSAVGVVVRVLLFLNDLPVADHQRHRPRQAPLGEESEGVSSDGGILGDIDLDEHFLSRDVGLSGKPGLFELDLLDRLHFGSQTIATQPDGPDPLQIFSAHSQFQGGTRRAPQGRQGEQFGISFPILRGFLGPKPPGSQNQNDGE